MPSSSYQDDEIDLKELFLALWHGKLTIVSTTIIITAIAIAYAMLAKQVWTTEAVVTAPQLSTFSEYRTQVSDYQPIFDIYQDDGTVLVSEKLDTLVDPNTLFTTFIQNFNSISNKKAFLESSEEFKEAFSKLKKMDDGKLNKKEVSIFYNTWYKKLSSTYVKGNSEDNFSYSLAGNSSTSDASYRFLLTYIAFIENKTNAVLIANLKSMVSSKQSELTNQGIILTDQAKSRLLSEKERAEYALQIAEAASVDKPVQNLGSHELFAINIGADALKAKVKVLSGLKNLSIIDPTLEQVTAKLKSLANMKINQNIQFHSFQYITTPESPISRTSPKRPLIAILGVLLGGMLGVAIVLVRQFFRKD